MKKYLLMLVAVLVAVAVAAPALAAIEFKYGGQFRARWMSSNNEVDGSDSLVRFFANGNDHTNFIDQRLRLYFTFQSSENLKVVVKFEMGDTVWGESGTGFRSSDLKIGRLGPSSGGEPGADAAAVEVKNAYIDFAIPGTPTRALIGIQGLNLLDSWIIDDDFAAAVFVTKLDPFTITAGYVSGQNSLDASGFTGGNEGFLFNRETDNIDDFFLSLDYAQGPFKATLTGFYQDGHNTPVSVLESSLSTPVTNPFLPTRVTDFTANIPLNFATITPAQSNGVSNPTLISLTPGPVFVSPVPVVSIGTVARGPDAGGAAMDWFGLPLYAVRDNSLFDLGFNFTYKVDWLKAYVSFVKNFGSVDTLSGLSPNFGNTLGGTINNIFTVDAFGRGTSNNQLVGAVDPFTGQWTWKSHDYTGWMIDAGVSYYCGPWTVNLGGFYTSGQSMADNPVAIADLNTRIRGTGVPIGVPLTSWKMVDTTGDLSWFNYPLSTGKYFSEIVGGGILDGGPAQPGTFGGARSAGDLAAGTNFWRGWHFPTNLWTITAGAAWQVLPDTKLSLSYWYFGTPEEVMSSAQIAPLVNAAGAVIPGRFQVVGQNFANDVGHELDLYVTQKIYDGFTLDLVAAYMITGDAFANSWNGVAVSPVAFASGWTAHPENYSKDDVWKLGARLLWNF